MHLSFAPHAGLDMAAVLAATRNEQQTWLPVSLAGQSSAGTGVDPGESAIARTESLHPLWAPLETSADDLLYCNPHQGTSASSSVHTQLETAS